MLEPNLTYDAIFFSGAGFYIPFHFGVIKCFQERNIKFEKSYGISSGAYSALTMLGALDVDISLRQCLESFKEYTYFTWDYAFDLMLAYFATSREAKKVPIEEINGRFHVGLFDIKNFTRYYKNTFTSEEDLKISTILSANVSPIIRLLPKSYNNGLFFDPLIIDPKIDKGKLNVAVTPFSFKFHLPEAKAYVNGSYPVWKCLFPNRKICEDIFFEGYYRAKALVKEDFSISKNLKIPELEITFKKILKKTKNWRRERGFTYQAKTKNGNFVEIAICSPNCRWDKFIFSLKQINYQKIILYILYIAIIIFIIRHL